MKAKLIVLSTVILLAACGGGGSETSAFVDDSSGVNQNPPTTSAPPPTNNPVTGQPSQPSQPEQPNQGDGGAPPSEHPPTPEPAKPTYSTWLVCHWQQRTWSIRVEWQLSDDHRPWATLKVHAPVDAVAELKGDPEGTAMKTDDYWLIGEQSDYKVAINQEEFQGMNDPEPHMDYTEYYQFSYNRLINVSLARPEGRNYLGYECR